MVQEPVEPRVHLLRSPLYRWHQDRGAHFEVVHGDAVVASSVGRGLQAEVEIARRLALVDCSTLPRIGFKGGAAIEWAGTRGLGVSPANNHATRQSDGSWVARLADTEVLVLADPTGDTHQCGSLDAAWTAQQPPACALILRRHVSAWQCLLGEYAAQTLAKLCGVDLRPAAFVDGSVAQTSAARTGIIIVRADVGATLAYHLLPDSASARYLWACVIDAMGEFDGRAVGFAALRALAPESGPDKR